MASIISAGTTSGTSLNLSGDTSGVLQLATNGSTTAVTVDTSQNVGIGTASPATKAEIYGTAAANNLALRITNTATDGYSTLQLGDANAGVYRNGSAQSGYAGASSLNLITVGAHNIGFSTQNTLRATITSAGNVGIGTTSPASLLDVTGNDPTIRLTDNAGSPASTWSIRSTDGNFAIRDVTNSFDRATFNANGCMALTGANLTATGIGITFPATQSASSDANTLDDYEEGTWSPVVQGSTTAGTATYANQNARYTKIGRMVQFEFYLNWSSGNGSGNLLIGGLPFATGAASTYPSFAIGYWDGISISANTVPMCFAGNGATTISFIVMLSGGSGIGVVGYDGAGAIQVSGCYSV